jgi:hypothetical protein
VQTESNAENKLNVENPRNNTQSTLWHDAIESFFQAVLLL